MGDEPAATRGRAPLRLGARLCALAACVVPGVDLDSISPLRAIDALPPGFPVLLLHAGLDSIVPLTCGQQLAQLRGLPLEVFADAGHAGCLASDPARYERLLRQLLAEAHKPR